MVVQNSSNIPSVTGTAVVGTGTGFTTLGYATTPTASTLSERDANSNLSSNNFIAGYATTATAAGTTTLTVGSAEQQYFTGTTTQTVVLPVTSTLVQGQSYLIVNNSSDVVTVQSSGLNNIQVMSANTQLIVTVINTGVTTAAGWNAVYSHSGGTSNVTKTTYVTSTPYNVTSTDDVILVDTVVIGAASAIELLASPTQDGKVWTIKDFSGDAFTNNITISGSGNNIDGASSVVITSAYQSVSICWDASETKYSLVYEYANPSSPGSVTIDGDSGSATGSMLTLTALNGGNNSGASVKFVASGSDVVLNVTDASSNTFIGNLSGSLTTTSGGSTGLGGSTLNLLSNGLGNTAVGYLAGAFVATGEYNLCLGFQAGDGLTAAESHNIFLNSSGSSGDNHTLRIGEATGTGQQYLNKAFICGINGNTVSNALMVTVDSTTNQLGTTNIPNSATTLVQANPYTILSTDQVLLVDTVTIGAPSALSLPATPPKDGQVWTIKDYSGDAGTFPITLDVTGGGTIDGFSSLVLGVSFQAISVCWDQAESAYSVVYAYVSGGGASGITSLTGDSGTATGSSVELSALDGVINSGATVKFVASAAKVVLNVTDASNNTFLGLDAGNATYTGIDNTAIGRSALAGLTSGAQNVAIGQQTLLVNTNGLRNVAIGGGTLNSSVTGDDNIAIGTGALTLSDGSSNNIAIGTSALAAAVSTTQNIAIGNLTLGLLNGGSQNVAIGPQAGGQVTNGTYNLYIGWSAGFLNDAGENYNIYLNSPGVAGESNTLRLGAATGTSAQELNKAFIYGINGAGLTGTPALVVIDPATDQLGSSLTLATAPPSSNTATTGFGSLAVGTALQNTLGYDILVNVSIAITAAVGASISLGVGPTNTPTTNPVTAAFSVALTASFSAVVPSGYYCLVTTGGTITVGSITTQVCPL